MNSSDVANVVPLNDFPATFFDLTATHSFSKVSCIEEFYVIHILTAYGMVGSGIGCFITRFYQKWLHKHFGRFFIADCLFCTATSILIHNTGMPRSILTFFTIMLFSMTIGWGVIRIYSEKVNEAVLRKADEMYVAQGLNVSETKAASMGEDGVAMPTPISSLMADAKVAVLTRPRTFTERLFNLKTLHGVLMIIAWYQMFGRTMITNPWTSWSGCETYPALKKLGPNGEIQLVPAVDPTFFENETTFAIMAVSPVFALTLIGAVVVAYCNARKDKKRAASLEMTSAVKSTTEASAEGGLDAKKADDVIVATE